MITDWKIGSSIKFHSEYNGIIYEQWGSILEFIPQKYVKYSLFAPRPDLEDKPENYFSMAYQLETQDDTTVLTVTQEDPRQSEVEHNENDESGKAILEGLKKLVETQII
ncbi:MAG: ATPase [Candidatus Saccharibacteria bacterium]|nr:ATPase [Candidatus Saccharibacteria bacterium]